MLDDINSELLSIYPGTFPSPRPFSKKPLIYNSGFHILVRPSLQLYRVQCNNDYIAEKSKKAEAAIRKLYKAAVHTGSTASFKETNSIFQHEASAEAILSKYRETQIYTKSRLRKVNRKQLIKAINLVKRKEDDDIRKSESIISRSDPDPSTRQKLKPRSYGALKIENRVTKMKKSLGSTSAPEPNSWSENFNGTSAADVTCSLETRDCVSEAVSKARDTPVRRAGTSKRFIEARKRTEDASPDVMQSKEYAFREEEGETGVMKRAPLKEGNYTTIVTLKKKSWLKPETVGENQFNTVRSSAKRNDVIQKVKKEESKNEIDHIYKINSRFVKVDHKYPSREVGSVRSSFIEVAEPADSLNEEMGGRDAETTGDRQDGSSLQEVIESPLPPVEKAIRRASYKYGGYKTDSIPHGIQPHESATELGTEASATRLLIKPSKSTNFPPIGETETVKTNFRYGGRKGVKREERFLQLPKITPTLTIDDPKDVQRRKNHSRVNRMKYLHEYYINYSK